MQKFITRLVVIRASAELTVQWTASRLLRAKKHCTLDMPPRGAERLPQQSMVNIALLAVMMWVANQHPVMVCLPTMMKSSPAYTFQASW